MNKRFGTLLMTSMLASAVLLGAGCESGAGEKPALAPSPAAPQKTEPAKPTLALPKKADQKAPETVAWQQAWKAGAVQTFDAYTDGNKAWGPLAMGNDGTILGNLPRQNTSSANEVVLYNVETKKSESIATLKDTQIVSGDVNENWVVWTEALDQNLSKWNIHAYDRHLKQDKIVAQSAVDAQGNAYPGPIVMPKLYGDEFVFSPTTAAPNDKGTSVFVKRYNLKTGKMEDIAQGGNPVIAKDAVLWYGPDDVAKAGALFLQKGGAVQQVTQGTNINYFATDGSAIAWSVLDQKPSTKEKDDSTWTIGLIENGTERKILTTEASDALQFLTMGPRILAWTAYKNVQVYDRKLDKIVTLETKDAEYSSVYANDNYLYWTTPIPQTEDERKQARMNGIYPAKVHVVDLRKL